MKIPTSLRQRVKKLVFIAGVSTFLYFTLDFLSPGKTLPQAVVISILDGVMWFGLRRSRRGKDRAEMLAAENFVKGLEEDE